MNVVQNVAMAEAKLKEALTVLLEVQHNHQTMTESQLHAAQTKFFKICAETWTSSTLQIFEEKARERKRTYPIAFSAPVSPTISCESP